MSCGLSLIAAICGENVSQLQFYAYIAEVSACDNRIYPRGFIFILSDAVIRLMSTSMQAHSQRIASALVPDSEQNPEP